MPPPRKPITRSGGPPKTTAVEHSKKKTKKTKTWQAAGTTRRPRPVPPGSAAETTEVSSDDPFIHLSRLANLKGLRDAAADHPGVHSTLLDFLAKQWGQTPQSTTPTRNYVDPPQSTPTNVQPYFEDNEGALDSSIYSDSEPEQVVRQAIQFLVGCDSEPAALRGGRVPSG
jgi:hypothetical protein